MNFSRIISIIILMTIGQQNLYSQNEILDTDTTIYIAVDKNPILIVNDSCYELYEIQNFINRNLVFPDNQLDCSGTVYISFIIEKDGTINNKEFYKKLCPGFDENAMKVVDLMEKWKPGIKNNVPVRTKLTLPIIWKFK